MALGCFWSIFRDVNILLINAHLNYPGWSEGKLNLTFMECAKAFLVERGHQVAETLVERGYRPDEEVQKHLAAALVILQTPVNWFGATWNAPRETFDNPASYLYGGKGVADLFLPDHVQLQVLRL